MKSGRERGQSVQAALAPHDLLAGQVIEFDSDILVRRLLERGASSRAGRLVETLNGADKASASGWLALKGSGPKRALLHFKRALALDPGHRPAILGLAIADTEEFDTRALDPREKSFVEAIALRNSEDYEALARLDGALAEWEPGSLLYPEATRMRVEWRLRTRDPGHARSAFDLIDRLIPRDRAMVNLLFRTRAAAAAGLDDRGWATLDRIRTRLNTTSASSRRIARRALGAAGALDSIEGAKETKEGLELIADSPPRSPGKGRP